MNVKVWNRMKGMMSQQKAVLFALRANQISR